MILPSTKSVPFGASSTTFAVPSTSPLFVTSIVYNNFSPAFTSVLSTFLVNVIIGFFSVSVSFPFTFAVFIIVPSFTSSTVTLKLTVPSSPAPNTRSIPVFRSVSPRSFLSTPFTFMLPSTKLVPSGIVSVTFAVPSTFPLFVTVIVYSISSPTTTAVLFDVFSLFIIGLYTVISDGFVVLSPTKAIFSITLLSPSKAFTVTSKVSNFVSPGFNSTLFQVILLPSTLIFSASIPDTLFSTRVVPSGAESLTVVLATSFPLFVTEIVYFTFEPSFSSFMFSSLETDLFVEITGFVVSSESFPSAIATFFMSPSVLSTITVKLTVTDDSLFTSTSHVIFPSLNTPSLDIGVSVSNVVPSGILSVTVTFLASTVLLLFFTVISYVILLPT